MTWTEETCTYAQKQMFACMQHISVLPVVQRWRRSALTWMPHSGCLLILTGFLAAVITSVRAESGAWKVDRAEYNRVAMLGKLQASLAIWTGPSRTHTHTHTHSVSTPAQIHKLVQCLIRLLKTLMSHRHLSSPWIYLISAKAKEHSISKALCAAWLFSAESRKNF